MLEFGTINTVRRLNIMRDEEFYGLAAHEIAERQFSQSLMAKAYALALGDAEKEQ